MNTDADGRSRLVRGASAAALAAVTVLAGLTLLVGPALAHGGSLRAAAGSMSVPTWLFLLTGGGVVGASFLMASFVTDRALIQAIHDWHRVAGVSLDWLTTATRAASVVVLVGVVAVGYVSPETTFRNAAVLVVWVGWWAGYVATVYLVGNTWPALNPWRAIADVLPSLDREYPEDWGVWPSVVGLLGLVWLEVVSPLADEPRLLATVVVGYTVVTLAGAVAFGSDTWFRSVDPVSQVFRHYGWVAPFGRSGDADDGSTGDSAADSDDGSVGATPSSHGIEFRPPGAGLTEEGLVDGFDEVAFVVALLWVTTYDGFVGTSAWVAIADAAVGVGVPAVVLYPVAMVAGFGLFLGVYWLASHYARKTADTYLTVPAIARRFAPSLLPIAAGYHLAHFLGYFLTWQPALVEAVTSPFTSLVNPPIAILPGWFGLVAIGFVLVGHLLAVAVAHASAYEVFPGRLQAVRSQYPFVVVMVLYTMTSLWIVATPAVEVPYV